jgi:hypothetical protein
MMLSVLAVEDEEEDGEGDDETIKDYENLL